ncbi:MAG: hypothetical protein DHS20C17_15020 [Cyclobacteriaceae bacterium]|nr:MAG: hypothetical protein DHS20C17_15020 [Cyclobacteriaceae bacterium]
MIEIDDTLISDDIKTAYFTCDLKRCKGACCVEGDLGAPLEDNELPVLKEIYPRVAPYLSAKGRQAIEQQGTFIKDFEDDFSTPTIDGKECAYAVYDENKVLKCGIESAYIDGQIDFQKPISCHLYPVRITSYEQYDAVNYDRWQICDPACSLGKSLKIPLYKFLKIPLIRKYGAKWYEKLLGIIDGGND